MLQINERKTFLLSYSYHLIEILLQNSILSHTMIRSTFRISYVITQHLLRRWLMCYHKLTNNALESEGVESGLHSYL